jgi:hypothetical protein
MRKWLKCKSGQTSSALSNLALIINHVVAHELEHEFDLESDRLDDRHNKAQNACVLNEIAPWDDIGFALVSDGDVSSSDMAVLDQFYTDRVFSLNWPFSHGHRPCDYDILVAYYRTFHP